MRNSGQPNTANCKSVFTCGYDVLSQDTEYPISQQQIPVWKTRLKCLCGSDICLLLQRLSKNGHCIYIHSVSQNLYYRATTEQQNFIDYWETRMALAKYCMASYVQGYDEERFVSTVSRNFLCLICYNVLREPVLCPRNHHCFCRSCITKYLETAQRCPTCADELTVETLAKPPRMVKDYLNELDIHCQYVNRGCQEIVQLQHLDRHEATCGFTPVVCTNQGCGVTVSKRDLVHHESDLCEFRKLKCHSCGEMTKTLADLEKKMEKNKAAIETKLIEMDANMERNVTDIKTDMEEKHKTVNNEVRG